ncbi:MAG: histidine phosphotransferase family protein [Alphaproteobacteria bacterium]
MNESPEFSIAEALCSHLCHELISPITAVNNGLELLGEDESGMAADALELVRHSALEASRRLQFYRLAYGQATGFETDPGFKAARALAQGLLANGKIALDWAPGDGRLQPGRDGAKLALNMVALARDALPRGGAVVVTAANQGAHIAISVLAKGPGAGLKDEMRAAMTAEPSAVGPRTVQAYLTAHLAQGLGTRLTVGAAEGDGVLMTALVPASH